MPAFAISHYPPHCVSTQKDLPDTREWKSISARDGFGLLGKFHKHGDSFIRTNKTNSQVVPRIPVIGVNKESTRMRTDASDAAYSNSGTGKGAARVSWCFSKSVIAKARRIVVNIEDFRAWTDVQVQGYLSRAFGFASITMQFTADIERQRT